MTPVELSKEQKQFLDAIDERFTKKILELHKFLISRKEVLTIKEVSTYTGLSVGYLYRLTSNNEIPFYKPNNKVIYVKRVELEEWLLRKKAKTKAEISNEAATYIVLNNK